MSNLWTVQEENLLRQLVKIDKTITEIENIFTSVKGMEGFVVNRSYKSVAEKIKRMHLESKQESIIDQNFSILKKITEQYNEETLDSYPLTSGKSRFILSMSDIHLPFAPADRLISILDKYKTELSDPNSILVLNGDILDEYAASIFPKYKEVHLLQEYKAAFSLVKICLEYVNNIALTKGNHEKRLNRMMSGAIPNSVSSMFSFDLLAKLSAGEVINNFGEVVDIDKDLRNRVRYQLKESWYCRIGKTIFAHPSGFGSAEAPGSTACKVNRIFNQRYSKEDYDSLVIGHTHHQSQQIIDGRLIIEQGALCGLLGYEGKDDLKFGFSTNGYAVIWQDADGNTNFNESRFIALGQSIPKKKQITWNKQWN